MISTSSGNVGGLSFYLPNTLVGLTSLSAGYQFSTKNPTCGYSLDYGESEYP